MNKILHLCALTLAAVAPGCKRETTDSNASASPKPPSTSARSESVAPTPQVKVSLEDLLAATDTNSPAPNAPLSEGDKAWMELLKAMEFPGQPAEWETTAPTPEAVSAFKRTNAVMVAVVADKAHQFYTKHPDHVNAAEARERERFLLGAAEQLGNTNVAARLEALDEARLKDPKLPEDERFELRFQQVERVLSQPPDTITSAAIDKMEASIRALQKEFTNQTELGALLLTPAEHRLNNNQPDKARALATEVADATGEPEVQRAAQALLKKIGRVGKPLEVKFKAVDGREVDLQSMKGKVVLVDFWATWCGPCMAELPKVKAAYEKLHSKGFEIIGISFDRDKTTLEGVLKREKMEWPQHFEDSTEGSTFGEQFDIESIPAMWLVDKKGNLRNVNARDGLVEKVEKLLAE